MRRTRRPLGPEDTALWAEVAKSVRPMGRKFQPDSAVSEPVLPNSTAQATSLPPLTVIAPFEVASRAAQTPKVILPGTKDHAIRMDARAYMRMRRGKLLPEARIDLHGMTVAEAHSALTGFVLRAHGAGMRLVLVITGKGKPGADPGARGGVLRHQVPHWLQLAPLGPRILQVAEAHPSHGGGGALYVYLRKAG